MTGRADFSPQIFTTTLPLLRDGKLVALAVSAPKRTSIMPEVPTTVEAGLKADSIYPFYSGFFVPAKTPRAVVEKLHQEAVKALQAPAVQERLKTLGVEPMPMNLAAVRQVLPRRRRGSGSAGEVGENSDAVVLRPEISAVSACAASSAGNRAGSPRAMPHSVPTPSTRDVTARRGKAGGVALRHRCDGRGRDKARSPCRASGPSSARNRRRRCGPSSPACGRTGSAASRRRRWRSPSRP